MKLLHSKRFKKNLGKWLTMYVGVMLLFTSVVTYSKYVSSFQVADEAKSAQFNMKIDCLNCEGSSGNTFDSGSKRPNAEIIYYFKMTPNFEVNTDVELTAFVHEDFKLVSVETVNLENLEDKEDLPTINIEESTTTIGRTAISFETIRVNASNQISNFDFKKYGFKIVVKYNTEKNPDYYKYPHPYTDGNNVVYVGYKAEQVK